ncbi:hypothetical protein [Alicyclobacillus sp. SP_1]|uniref:hypothetical protein n=1 Tax=Alicyclobacillus sp. SP_1 TaxID=2942475 RepID=UPI0021579C93|nr:hypothetical protein [Alicyclobacillus sp. SP_1]
MPTKLFTVVAISVLSTALAAGCGSSASGQSIPFPPHTSAAHSQPISTVAPVHAHKGHGSEANGSEAHGSKKSAGLRSSSTTSADFGPAALYASIAATLHLSAPTVLAKVRAGASLASLATEQHVTKTRLIAALRSSYRQHLHRLTQSGALSAQAEGMLLSHFDRHIEDWVNQAGLPKFGDPAGVQTSLSP